MDYFVFFLLDEIFRIGHLDVFLLNLLAIPLILSLKSSKQSETLFLVLCKSCLWPSFFDLLQLSIYIMQRQCVFLTWSFAFMHLVSGFVLQGHNTNLPGVLQWLDGGQINLPMVNMGSVCPLTSSCLNLFSSSNTLSRSVAFSFTSCNSWFIFCMRIKIHQLIMLLIW